MHLQVKGHKIIYVPCRGLESHGKVGKKKERKGKGTHDDCDPWASHALSGDGVVHVGQQPPAVQCCGPLPTDRSSSPSDWRSRTRKADFWTERETPGAHANIASNLGACMTLDQAAPAAIRATGRLRNGHAWKGNSIPPTLHHFAFRSFHRVASHAS
jgi:hypothetical protein